MTGPHEADAVTAAYTAGMREMWGRADYPGLAERLAPAAAALVDAAGPVSGRRVLDLAAGTGNVTVLAAARGASVVACDLSPEMVRLGRERSAAAGLDVDWCETDAEDLPLPDATVDAVLSAFGLIFVPRPVVALRQVRRVLAPDGVLAFTAWAPDGFMGAMTQVMRRWLPRPAGVADMLDWAREPALRGWLDAAGFDHVERRPAALPWNFDSPAAMTRFLLAHSPAHQASADALGPRAGDMFGAVERVAGPDGDPVRIEADYALVTARPHG